MMRMLDTISCQEKARKKERKKVSGEKECSEREGYSCVLCQQCDQIGRFI